MAVAALEKAATEAAAVPPQPAPRSVEDAYHQTRPVAAELRSIQDETWERAHALKRDGQHDLAAQQFAQARKRTQDYHDARERAEAACMSVANQDFTNSVRVDIHGLHVSEAEKKVLQAYASLVDLARLLACGMTFKVICGVGHHSVDRTPHLRPAIKALLTARGIRFDELPGRSNLLVHVA